jgi:non-specific serine/threonine protein kinase
MGGLPREVTGFVGRRQETAQVKRLLSKARLVTLTGAAGVGKSRLALRVGDAVRRAFADGVWLVEFAELGDASLVGSAVAAELELPNTSAQEPESALEAHLADKRLLLVLDNCEHLLGTCGGLVASLLPRAPGLRVLATSREPLGIPGEHVWPVRPLSVPSDAEALSGGSAQRYEALALFEERANAVVPGFELGPDNNVTVAQLCRRLDGLPLAIELAAARLRALSVEQMLATLEDRYELSTAHRAASPRHQTLRAAVEWSFDLCSELERILWARLSVFAGGFDLEAAESVGAGDGLAAEDVFEGVVGLLDKSVLTREEGEGRARYRMLNTIRHFGREQRARRGEESVLRKRHRDYYLRLAERAEADWFGPHQPEWLDRFHVDHADVWAALDFSLAEPGEVRGGLRMTSVLWWYWIGRAIRDGRQWLGRALALDTESSHERAKALWVDGWVAVAQGDTPHAVPMLDECVAVARLLGAGALTFDRTLAGMTKPDHGLLPDAVPLLEQAVADYRATGVSNPLAALALCNLPTVANLLGDPEHAAELCEEWSAICEAQGERWTRSWALWVLAVARWRQGDVRQAGEHAKESLKLKRVLDDKLGLPCCIGLLGAFAMADGETTRAAFLFGMSEKMWEPIGEPIFGWGTFRDWSEQWKARAREILGQQAFGAACERGRQLTVEAALADALGERAEPPPGTRPQPSLPQLSQPGPSLPQLTRREREVAELVAQGESNKEIAASLTVSQRTAETHVEHILSKLGFASRTQIAAWYIRAHDASARD